MSSDADGAARWPCVPGHRRGCQVTIRVVRWIMTTKVMGRPASRARVEIEGERMRRVKNLEKEKMEEVKEDKKVIESDSLFLGCIN